jgi:hypothetical protein
MKAFFLCEQLGIDREWVDIKNSIDGDDWKDSIP